jgi:hypothetical protein
MDKLFTVVYGACGKTKKKEKGGRGQAGKEYEGWLTVYNFIYARVPRFLPFELLHPERKGQKRKSAVISQAISDAMVIIIRMIKIKMYYYRIIYPFQPSRAEIFFALHR